MYRISLAAVLAASLVACSQSEPSADAAGSAAAPGAPNATDGAGSLALATEDEKIIYSLGLALGENIAEFSLDPAELDIVVAGMRDAVTKMPYRVDLQTYGPQIQGLQLSREKDAGAAFGEQIAAEPGARSLPSGLIYVPVESGDGDMPAASDTVTVHYEGTLRDGTVFDSSRERGEPASFPLDGVIPCWTEGVQLMHVGETAKLFCPSDIAYGDRGSPPVIAGGASLLFEVELLGIGDAQ
jgi:FKBP-type peptidyl-prolyl cis-trans isomerase FkpA